MRHTHTLKTLAVHKIINLKRKRQTGRKVFEPTQIFLATGDVTQWVFLIGQPKGGGPWTKLWNPVYEAGLRAQGGLGSFGGKSD